MHARSKVYSQAHSSAKSGANGDARDTQSTAHKPCEGTDVPVIMLQLACVRSLPSAAPRCIHGAPTVQVTASTCDHRRTPAAREPLSGQLRPPQLHRHPTIVAEVVAATPVPPSRWRPPWSSACRRCSRYPAASHHPPHSPGGERRLRD